MNKPRKRYFAQNASGPGHRARHFHTVEEARAWLADVGGGTIKQRGAWTAQDPVIGPVSVQWREVEEVMPA